MWCNLVILRCKNRTLASHLWMSGHTPRTGNHPHPQLQFPDSPGFDTLFDWTSSSGSQTPRPLPLRLHQYLLRPRPDHLSSYAEHFSCLPGVSPQYHWPNCLTDTCPQYNLIDLLNCSSYLLHSQYLMHLCYLRLDFEPGHHQLHGFSVLHCYSQALMHRT